MVSLGTGQKLSIGWHYIACMLTIRIISSFPSTITEQTQIIFSVYELEVQQIAADNNVGAGMKVDVSIKKPFQLR